MTSIFQAFYGRTVFFKRFLSSDSDSDCRTSSLHVDVIFDRGRNPEKRREEPFHIPLVVKSPVFLARILPLLIALPRFGEGKVKVLFGDNAVADPNCTGPLSIDGKQDL